MTSAVRAWCALAAFSANFLSACACAADEDAECGLMLLQTELDLKKVSGRSSLQAASAATSLNAHLKSTLGDTTNCIWSVALSHEARHLATGSCDGKLRVYDVALGSIGVTSLTTLTDADGDVGTVAFWHHNDHYLLGAGSVDTKWRLYNMTEDSPELIVETQAAGIEVDAFAFAADSPILAVGSDGGDTQLYAIQEPAKPQLMGEVASGSLFVSTVAIIPHGARMAIGHLDGTLKVFSTTAAGLQQIEEKELGSRIINIAYSPNNELLAVAMSDGTAMLFDNLMERDDDGHAMPMQLVSKIEVSKIEVQEPVNAVAFSLDSSLMATGSWDHAARIYDISNPAAPRLLATIDDAEDRIYSVAFTEDPAGEIFFATGSKDGQARLYHVEVTKSRSELPSA